MSTRKRTATTPIASLDDLTPDPQNARAHNERNVGAITSSLQEVGAARSIVIDEHGVVLAGNATVKAAKAAGFKLQVVDADGETVIAVRRSGLSPLLKTRLALADNRAAELATWDTAVLAQLADTAPAALAGLWNAEEMAQLLAAAAALPVINRGDPDDVPDERATSITRGQIFELGPHRLMCGDSTSADDVAQLMHGDLAHVVFTDPPYGVDYQGGTKKRAALADDHRGTDIYGAVLPRILQASHVKAPVYLWHAGTLSDMVASALAAHRFEIRAQLIWNKNQAQFGALTAQYKQKHEPCFYAFRKGQAPWWYGPTNEVSVWDVKREQKNEFHPTQKPVELAERALDNSSQAGDVVLDLFGGSGSTLMGATTKGRRARVMELKPSYCQVILDRWEAFTGEQAVAR